MVPWTRLGPEAWLPKYKIASLYGWDLPSGNGLPEVVALTDLTAETPQLKKLNTQELLKTKQFQDIIQNKLAGYSFFTYKPVVIPKILSDRTFMMVDKKFTELFENKVEFRELLKDSVRFPDYVILERSQLQKTEAMYLKLLAGRNALVIQDEQLSGAKGTFIVHSYEEYTKALSSLDVLSHSSRVVVSSLIEGAKERTIQCCVTKDGVVTGPLQRQIVANPLLANMSMAEGDKFCGVQILEQDQNTPLHQEMERTAQIIGSKLKQRGYRGIFGIDFLIDASNELFVLEVNARITGATPLLTAISGYADIVPFYLLHLLELGGFSYQITDTNTGPAQDGALLVLHSLEKVPVEIVSIPKSGTYTLKQNKLTRVSDNIVLGRLKEGEFIIQAYMPPHMKIKPGGRFLTLQFKAQVLDENTDQLYNTTDTVIRSIYEQIVVKPAN